MYVMQLEFIVNGQILKRIDTEKPVENSHGYLTAHFALPSQYTGTISAYFKILQNGVFVGEPMQVDKATGICYVPDSINKAGNIYVSLSSTDTDLYIPTNLEIVKILPSGVPTTILQEPDGTFNEYESFQKMYDYIKSMSGGTGTGTVGVDGKSIEYTWSGTSLGIRLEGEAIYQYVNLKGEKGDTGAQGIQGLQGLQGLQGATGEQGVQGDTGLQGIQGLKGDKGDTGAQGIQGAKGDTGDTGLQGIKGDTGLQGIAGTGIVNQRTGIEMQLWSGSQTEYTALGTYDSNTVYLISG